MQILARPNMQPLDESARTRVRRLALGGGALALADSQVFARTDAGREEALRRPARLPRRLRTLLLVVDARASVGELRRGLSRYRGLDDGLDMLRRMGLIEPVAPRR